MSFTFLEVNDNDLLEKVFEFRYKIFLEIYPEYLKKSGFTDNKEYDKYDPHSTHFVALDDNNEVCATVRLIYNSPIGYPTENSMVFNNDMFSRDKLGEMSRIFVDAKSRNIKTTNIILHGLKKLMYLRLMSLGIEYTYGSLEASFFRLLGICKINYKTIGEEQTHEDFGSRIPSILYTNTLGSDNPELIRLWEIENEA